MNEYFGKREDAFDTDLACERRRADINVPGVFYKRERRGIFVWERIDITSHEGEEAIGRPMGSYDTLSCERMDTLDVSDIEDASNEIASELCRVFDKTSVIPSKILVVGLGNSDLTPDSVGPSTACMVNATMHLRKYDNALFESFECSEIAVLTPGVMAKTGMESTDTVSAVCDLIEPDVVIAIDSIASRSPTRLGTTIQISNTGIFPGSGIGSRRKALSERNLGIPVIAIGVPTVINATALCDTCSEDIKDGEMFVSPRDIDAIVSASSKIISQGINQAFGIF
jgi:spore protease